MKAFNAQSLRDKFLKEEEQKENKTSNKKKDPRILNYFDLDFNQTMTIRLLPDGGESGDLWTLYETHGPNLKNRNIDSISCVYKETGESCSACGYSYGLHTEGNKKEAARWRGKETAIGQCVVVESPIEITPSEDDNLVKLFYVPYGMREAIKEAIVNGIIEDPTTVNFVIKKTKNQGGQASYSKSFFKPNDDEMPDHVVASLSDATSYLYDLSLERPAVSTAVEVQEWLDKAIQIDRTGYTPSSDDIPEQNENDQNQKDKQQSAESTESAETSKTTQINTGKTSASDLMATLKKRTKA